MATALRLAMAAGLSLMSALAQAGPGRVLLLRHAEKSASTAADPALSAAGQQRARQLAEQVAGHEVGALITSPLRRSRDTALPLAGARGLSIQTVSFAGGTAAHVQALAAAVRAQSVSTVLVVGHSNTIPALIEALGGPAQLPICESAYSHLFTLHLAADAPPQLEHAHYGEADPAPSEGCQ